MLNPKSLNEAFGLAKIQEEYNWSCKKNSKVQVDQGKPSILGVPPKTPSLLESKASPLREFPLHKWKKGRRRGYAIIVMRSGVLATSARMPCCSFLIMWS